MFSSKDFVVLKQVNRELSGKTQLYKDSINDFDVSIFEVNGLKIFIFEEGKSGGKRRRDGSAQGGRREWSKPPEGVQKKMEKG